MSARKPRQRPASLPALPTREKTAEEIAHSESLLAQMKALHAQLVQDNVAVAVRLAQQALCGHGPLVDHFSELGRDWAHLLDEKPVTARSRSRFAVIEGSVA